MLVPLLFIDRAGLEELTPSSVRGGVLLLRFSVSGMGGGSQQENNSRIKE